MLSTGCKKEIDSESSIKRVTVLKSGGSYTEDERFSGINQFLPKAVWDSNNFNTMKVDRALRYLEAAANVRLSHTDSFSVAWQIDSVDIAFSFSSSDSGLLISGTEIYTLNNKIHDTATYFARQADFNNLEDKFIKIIDLKWADESGEYGSISNGVVRVLTYTSHLTASKPCWPQKAWFFADDIPFQYCSDYYTAGWRQMQDILNSPQCNPQNCSIVHGANSCGYKIFTDIQTLRDLARHTGDFNECIDVSGLNTRISNWLAISESARPLAWPGSIHYKRILHNYQLVWESVSGGAQERRRMDVTYANCYNACIENVVKPFFQPSE